MSDLNFINDLAKENGFSVVGITNAKTSKLTQTRLDEFIQNKYHANLKWLEDKKEIRKSPKILWPDAKSAIIFGFNYGPLNNPLPELKQSSNGVVAVYARRKDYHKVLKGRLKQISNKLASKYKTNIKVFVDTAPIMEKPLASQAGVGWLGKHTNLVSKKYGSWLLLGVILVSKKLPTSKKHDNNCGSCKKCINICPTGAITEPYKLDARKCISYLTIEHKDQIPINLRKSVGNRIFGCDDCLAVCPWNNFAVESKDIKLKENKGINLLPLKNWLSLNENEFRSLTSGTNIKRTGYIRMMRNCLIAAGNSKDNSLIKYVKLHLKSENDIVRGSSIWALRQLLSLKEFNIIKKKYLPNEMLASIRDEWI